MGSIKTTVAAEFKPDEKPTKDSKAAAENKAQPAAAETIQGEGVHFVSPGGIMNVIKTYDTDKTKEKRDAAIAATREYLKLSEGSNAREREYFKGELRRLAQEGRA